MLSSGACHSVHIRIRKSGGSVPLPTRGPHLVRTCIRIGHKQVIDELNPPRGIVKIARRAERGCTLAHLPIATRVIPPKPTQ
jgi:hypothetical protein